jgi:hypothetical protein
VKIKRQTLLFLIIILFSWSCKPAIKTEKQSDIVVKFILNGKIPVKKTKAIEAKIKGIYKRIFEDFNLIKNQTCTIYIWENYEEFLNEQERKMGAKHLGVQGYIFSRNDIALYNNNRIIENAEHEFVHIASSYLNERFGNNPRWLWESVAIYEAGEFNEPKNIDYLRNGNFSTISELNGMVNAIVPNKIYQTGYLLSEFIINEWNRSTYLKLIKSSGNINLTLKVSEQEFERKWKLYISKKYLNK